MKKVTIVLGLGVSGEAAAEFLLKQGALVLAIDSNHARLHHPLKSLGLFIQHDSDPIEWDRVERLVVSPGIFPKHWIYKEAVENGVPVIGEAELALPHFKKPLVAVTGTNGKTTVTLLVEHILNEAGIRAKALGNVGAALCSYLLHPGDEQAFVVELSSFQLETMRTPVFEAGVLLNVTPDHLDRYESMEEYAKAKCRLQYLLKGDAQLDVQSEVAKHYRHLLQNYRVFDTIADIMPLDYREKGIPKWSQNLAVGRSESSRGSIDRKAHCIDNTASFAIVEPRGFGSAYDPIVSPLRYRHEWENALAAWALCQPFSITAEQFFRSLASFQKPPHRIEFVRDREGVCYYDDSKGTNIDAVIQAVRAMKGPVILIAGGVDKGASYLLWKEIFMDKVKKIIAIGEAAPKIYSELHPYFNVKCVENLHRAVQEAAAEAQNGDSVLLSPGCSSFDMFRDYAHRGEEYQRYVHSI